MKYLHKGIYEDIFKEKIKVDNFLVNFLLWQRFYSKPTLALINLDFCLPKVRYNRHMSFYELVIYIRNELAVDRTKEQIMENLIAAGWQKAEIKRAFAEAKKTEGMPISAITFSDLKPRRHHMWVRLGRGIVIFLLCLVIAFTVFSIFFNLGLIPR